jgi:putative polyketide hydroxylase
MYSRIAIQVQPSQRWRWVSTALRSITSVKQWLRHYHAYPSTCLRVCSAATREGVREQLPSERAVLPSIATPAAQFLSARSYSPAALMNDPNYAVHSVGGVLAAADDCLLDRRRDHLARGAGGDHDLPYRFALPDSMPMQTCGASDMPSTGALHGGSDQSSPSPQSSTSPHSPHLDPLDHVQVLIVGAGPTGLVAGITLARYGIHTLVVEKRDEISTLARAVVISTRTMELLRTWGLEEAVRAGAADVEPCGWVTYTLASGEGTVVPSGHPTTAQAATVSPTRPAWLSQEHLEPILLAYLRRSPPAEVRFGCELVALQQDEAGVRAVLLDRESSRNREVQARFVLAADGAHSTVRKHLGIGMLGPDDLAEFHTVQFTAPLGDVVAAHQQRYGLNIITHPDAAGVLIPHGPRDHWRFTWEWRPGQARLVDLPEAHLARTIATAVGVPHLQPHVERVGAFSFAAQIAERYRERRAFLMGDAAHRMTPRGGTGMNTAIHDAYDLGWKVAWVLRGWAEPSLLETYEAERRPVGLNNVARSRNPNGAQREYDEAAP